METMTGERTYVLAKNFGIESPEEALALREKLLPHPFFQKVGEGWIMPIIWLAARIFSSFSWETEPTSEAKKRELHFGAYRLTYTDQGTVYLAGNRNEGGTYDEAQWETLLYGVETGVAEVVKKVLQDFWQQQYKRDFKSFEKRLLDGSLLAGKISY